MEQIAAGSAADPENPPPTTESLGIDESAYSSQPSQNQNVDHSTSGNRDLYHHPKYSILRKAALNGVWEEAENLLGDDEDPLMLAAVITDEYETALHLATGASRISFVTEIIRRMEPEHLEMRDGNQNTAFIIAVIAGNIKIATVMLDKNPRLLEIRDSRGMTPLHMAVFLGINEMATFLYHRRTDCGYLTFEDRTELFFQTIKRDLYDLALKLVKDTSVLAVIRDKNEHTALHVLARKPSSIFEMKSTGNQESMSTLAPLQLVNHLWNEVEQVFVIYKELITKPSNLLFDAARLGNSGFLDALISSYPNLVHELDENGRTIFHVAISYNQIDVFRLINKTGFNKEIIAARVDRDANNILHLAAKYPDQSPESGLSSEALEMQKRLIIFQEVKKLIQPSLRGAKNADDLTPQQLFAKEHKDLQRSGAQWMGSTANACSLVATLIATVVFAAAFTVPGATDDKTGTPVLLKKTLFLVFAISDAIALSSSSFSILMFLSILTSGYTQSQFYISLPIRLFIGLLALFISIIFMMITFGSTYFLLYKHDRSYFVPILTAVLVSVPIPLFGLLQYPLLKDIFHLTRHSGFLSNKGFLSI